MPKPLIWIKTKLSGKHRAIDALAAPGNEVQLVPTDRKEAIERAVTRILTAAFDRGDHRLGYASPLRQIALGQARAPPRMP